MLTNLVLAFPRPRLRGGTQRVEESYPSFAYWPFTEVRAGLVHRKAPGAADGGSTSPPLVVFLSRERERFRRLLDEPTLTSAVGTMLRSRGYRFAVLPTHDSPMSRAASFRDVVGVIGVHGGAFANLHACPEGTRVIEILGYSPRGPHGGIRLYYAMLSKGLGLRYVAYFPRVWPEHYMTKSTNTSEDDGTKVVVDQPSFLALVERMFPARYQQLPGAYS